MRARVSARVRVRVVLLAPAIETVVPLLEHNLALAALG